MEIVDTAGQEEFSSFRDSSVATGDAFLVLFAINSASSWHELKDLRSKIIQDRQLTSAIPMVMVGNKLVSYFYSGTYFRTTPLMGHSSRSWKNSHIIFEIITSIRAVFN